MVHSRGSRFLINAWAAFQLWDARATTVAGPMQSVSSGERVYALDVLGNKIVVGTSDRLVVDVRYPLRKVLSRKTLNCSAHFCTTFL